MAAADLNRRTALQVLVAGGSAALLAGCGASGSAAAVGPFRHGSSPGTGRKASASRTSVARP